MQQYYESLRKKFDMELNERNQLLQKNVPRQANGKTMFAIDLETK